MSLKILLPLDGSPYSEMATETLKAFHFPSQTEVTVMTIVPEHIFLGGITFHKLRSVTASRENLYMAQENKAVELLKEPVSALQASGIKVDSMICRGKPAENIIEHAHAMPADLVVIGAKGTSNSRRFRLGGTTHKVIKYANSSVLLVKERTNKIKTVLFATDSSTDSDAAASLLLDLPIPKHSKVIIVTVLESYMTNIARTVGLDTESDEQLLLSELREAEDKAAQQLMAKVKKQFQQSGYDTESMVLRGDPAEQILTVSNTVNPDLIALGAKGLTGTKAFSIGSVAQRVARFSRCSVLISRVPEHQAS